MVILDSMTAPVWDPGQYLRHADHRTRPFHDLLARIGPLPHEPAPRIADLGCGAATSPPSSPNAGPPPASPATTPPPRCWSAPASTPGPSSTSPRPTPRPGRPPRRTTSSSPTPCSSGSPATPPASPTGWTPSPPAAPSPSRSPATSTHPATPSCANSPNPPLADTPRRPPAPRRRRAHPRRLPRTPHRARTHRRRLGDHLPAPAPRGGRRPGLGQGHRPAPLLDALADDPEARDAFLGEYRDLLRTAYPAGPHGTVFPFRRIFAVARTAG